MGWYHVARDRLEQKSSRGEVLFLPLHPLASQLVQAGEVRRLNAREGFVAFRQVHHGSEPKSKSLSTAHSARCYRLGEIQETTYQLPVAPPQGRSSYLLGCCSMRLFLSYPNQDAVLPDLRPKRLRHLAQHCLGHREPEANHGLIAPLR